MQFYIRLLTYLEANTIIAFINSIDNCNANLVTGGVSVHVSDIKDKRLIETELRNNYSRWEVSNESPHKVKEKIISKLGLRE